MDSSELRMKKLLVKQGMSLVKDHAKHHVNKHYIQYMEMIRWGNIYLLTYDSIRNEPWYGSHIPSI